MREILFRGKRIDKSEWVYGSYCYAELLNKSGYEHLIIEQSAEGKSHNVVAESVGQYTGLTDKNGTKIFEGDIVTYEDAVADFEGYHDDVFLNCGEVGISAWDGIYFTNRQTVDMSDLYESETMVDCEIIGNIHDNHEMLKG